MRNVFRPARFLVAALLLTTLAACAGSGEIVDSQQSYDADRLVIRDFIGTLTIVTTEAGGDINVEIEARQSQLDLLPIDVVGDDLVIAWEGEPDRTRRWWEFWRGRWMVDLNDIDNYPTLTVTVPADLEIEVESMIGFWTIDDRTGHLAFGADRGRGTIGTTETASIGVAGDAEVDLGVVARQLSVAIAGSGSVVGDSAGAAEIAIAGSGDLQLGDIAGMVTIDIAGSGSARIGNAERLEASLSGSGSLRLGDIGGAFVAAVQGSGSIAAVSASGAFEAAVSGSGSIRVDDGRAEPFEVAISGSGGVRFGGTAVNPSASISGSGGLILGRVEGDLDARTSGGGRVDVLN